jgi:hypothetical protein
MKKPSAKQTAEANIAFRGPAASSHFPNNAAERPSIKIASEKIQAICDCFQSPGPGFASPIN